MPMKPSHRSADINQPVAIDVVGSRSGDAPHATPQPTVPPRARSRIGLGFTAAAAEGRLAMQVCKECGTVLYPARELCTACLSEALEWREQTGAGTILAATVVRRPYELYFRERAPWRTGLVRLDCGVTVAAFLYGACPEPRGRVRVRAQLDRAGQGVLVALPEKDDPDMADDALLRELSNTPKGRRILVTDAATPLGGAMVAELVSAGAAHVWAGVAPGKDCAVGSDAGSGSVTAVPLDVTDPDTVDALADRIGRDVDILINTAEYHDTGSGIPDPARAQAEMETNYFGLLRLSEAFAPAMRARGADMPVNAVAWVNILSVFALSNYPAHGTFSASKAAALSLAQKLRAEMRPAGLRVVNVFPGPLDDLPNQLELPPKIAPGKLAKSIISALEKGIEDLYPDPIAREWYARWRSDPKVLELELTG